MPSEGRWRDACAFTVDLVDFSFLQFFKSSRVCCWLRTSTVNTRKGRKKKCSCIFCDLGHFSQQIWTVALKFVFPTSLPREETCGRVNDGLESPPVYGLISRWEKTVLIRIRASRHHNFSLGFMWSNLSKLWNNFSSLHFVLKHMDGIALMWRCLKGKKMRYIECFNGSLWCICLLFFPP